MACFRQWMCRRGLAWRRLSAAGCALGVGIFALSLAAGAKGDPSRPPAYRIIDLGKLGNVTGINNQGQVVGTIANTTGYGDAVIYDGTGTHDLGTLGGAGVYSQPTAINDVGQVVGVAATPPATDPVNRGGWTNHAFLYDGTAMHDLGTLGGESNAIGINNSGQIIGGSATGGTWHAFSYSNGVMRDLGFPPDLDFPVDQDASISVRAINASGQVLADIGRQSTHQSRVYLWQNGVWLHLSALDNGYALALNDAGQVTGSTGLGSSDIPLGHAFMYDSAGVHDLGTFGGPSSRAVGINNGGQIVGTAQIVAPPPAHPWLYENNGVVDHPFLYSGGAMYDLTNLLLTSAPWERFAPVAINDRGEIIGQGTWGIGTVGAARERSESFLLEPDPTAQVTAPQAPSGAAVKFVSLHELDLAWTDNSDNEQSFEIQRRQSWSAWVTIGSVPPNTTAYSDTSVDSYTHYLYRVRGINGAGASGWSNEAGGDSGSGAVARLGWNAQDFGSVPLGTSSDPVSLTVTNRGTAPLAIQAATLAGSDSGDFTVLESPTTLAPGDTGAIHLLFTPTALGSRSAQLILQSGATNLVEPIGLTGSGAPASVPTLSVSPTALDFGQQPVGLSGNLALLLQNTGRVPLPVGSIAVQGPDASEFALATDSCSGGTLLPGHICLLNIRFSPAATGSRTASLVINDGAADSPQLVPLTGIGTAPLLTLSAQSLLFAVQPAGTASAAQTLTLTNTGDAPLTVDALTVTGPDANSFHLAGTNGTVSLAPGASQTLTISFSPAAVARRRRPARLAAARLAAVSYSATLLIHDNDPHPGAPRQVTLTAVETPANGGSAPPAAPTGLAATAVSGSQVTLTWTSHSQNETAFAIWRQGGGRDWARIGVVPPGTTQFTDTSASPNVVYTYRVRATNNTGASDWTNAATLTTFTPPAAPTGLAASVDAETQVTLVWTSQSHNEEAFAIWRQGPAADWARVGVVPPGTTTYVDRGLTPGASYRYRVRATNDYASDWSNAIDVVMVTAPAAPTDLAASASAGPAVTLTWTSHSDNENAFAIWRQGGGSEWTRIGAVPPGTTRYTDRTAQPRTSYTYRVRATNRYASGWTNEVSVTAGAAP